MALCRLLLEKPDLLLLDEPTNHLDAESVSWLERTLRDYAGTVMVVTHDRYFLDNVTNWILEIERGRGYPFEGNYSSWLDQKRKRLAAGGEGGESRQRALAEELEWIRQPARRARPRARRASRNTRRCWRSRQELAGGTAEIVIRAGAAPGRHGDRGREAAQGLRQPLLIDELNFKLPPGGIVGVIGPNGAGKTTLFRMITGQDMPDAGALKIGDTVKLGYVDQSRDSWMARRTSGRRSPAAPT